MTTANEPTQRHAHPEIRGLQDALDAGEIPSKSVDFATSLIRQFLQNGKLSSNQMYYVKEMATAPSTRIHPVVDKLRTVISSLNERDSKFANDLISGWDKYGKISPKQLYWVRKLTAKGESEIPDTSNNQEGWDALVELFNQFEGDEHGRPLKRPTITLVVETDTSSAPEPQVPRWGNKGIEQFGNYNRELVIQPTSFSRKQNVEPYKITTKQLTFTEGERAYSLDSKRYLQTGKSLRRGIIHRENAVLTPTVGLPHDTQIVMESLRQDPIGTIRRLGRKTGYCSFCGKHLSTPESMAHGYGATCAKNAGLPHGKKSARVIVELMESQINRMVMELEGGLWAVVDLDTNEVITTFENKDRADEYLDEWTTVTFQNLDGDLVE
tara:strand:+ start:1971 stop:3116 length:1146 start_codon:yes stop_codon:yes gene_type:complete